MYVTIYLSKNRDIDLLLLRENGIKLGKLMKEVLYCHFNNFPFHFSLNPLENISEENIPKKMTVKLELDEEIYRCLMEIKDGYRSIFIKNVTRIYLGKQILNLYKKEPTVIKEEDTYINKDIAALLTIISQNSGVIKKNHLKPKRSKSNKVIDKKPNREEKSINEEKEEIMNNITKFNNPTLDITGNNMNDNNENSNDDEDFFGMLESF